MDDQRLALAKALGANETVKASADMKDVDDGVAKIKETVGGEVDVSFDCVGSSESMSTGLIATRSGGKVCLVGRAHGMMNVPLPVAAAREVDVVGAFRYKNTWPICLDFFRTRKIDVEPLLAHFGKEKQEYSHASTSGELTGRLSFCVLFGPICRFVLLGVLDV